MDEGELIEGLRQKDRAAFEHAYLTYKDLIFKTIYKYVDVLEDAEELVQDVFVKAFRKIDQFNGMARLSTWLIKIAINTALNFLQSIKKQKEVINKDADISEMYNDDTLGADIPNPEELAVQKNGRSVLITAMGKLSTDQHIACTLFYLEGLPQLDIAEIMDTSLDAVQSLIQRGKIKLRSILKSHKQNIHL